MISIFNIYFTSTQIWLLRSVNLTDLSYILNFYLWDFAISVHTTLPYFSIFILSWQKTNSFYSNFPTSPCIQMGITGTHRYIHTHTNIHLYSHTDWPHLKLMTRNPEQVGNESGQSCHISLVQLFSQSGWLFHTSVLIYHLLQPMRELLTHWENWNSSMRILTNSIYKYPISPTNVHPPSYFYRCTIPLFKISPSTFARNLFPDQWYIFSNLFVILYHPSLCYTIILVSIQTCYDVLHLTKHLPAVVVKAP